MNHLHSKSISQRILLFCAIHTTHTHMAHNTTYLSHANLIFFSLFLLSLPNQWFLMRCHLASCVCQTREYVVCGTRGTKRTKKNTSFSCGWYLTAASTFCLSVYIVYAVRTHTHYVNFSHFSPIQSAYTRRMFLVSSSFLLLLHDVFVACVLYTAHAVVHGFPQIFETFKLQSVCGF